jgi:hypothetical protein
MVEILEIPIFADKQRIIQKIRTKAKSCGLPLHWMLREPVKSNELIYLRPKDLNKRRGVRTQVRRVLYYFEYKGIPLKKITMVCGEKNCINPAHMRVRGFESEADQRIESQIEKGWLYPEDAEKWFGWKNEHNLHIPDELDFQNRSSLELWGE